MKKSKAPIKDLLQRLEAYQENTNTVKKATEFTKYKDNINLREGYNLQADHITMPTDKFGFKHLLVVVDIAKHSFDMEAQKSETAQETLKALQKIFKRGIITKPEASITTDGAGSFKSVTGDFLYDNSIFHKIEYKGRHSQLALVNNLIRQLSKIFNSLMNKEEIKTGKVSKSWVKYISMIREKLNAIMQIDLPKDPFYDVTQEPVSILQNGKLLKNGKVKLPESKFNIGDKVNILLTEPENASGKKQKFSFRSGDYRFSNKIYIIEDIFNYSGKILYRYKVASIDNVSYTEKQLRKV